MPHEHDHDCSKMGHALCMLRTEPAKWFHDAHMDERDKALLNTPPGDLLEYGSQTYLARINHMRGDTSKFTTTKWTVENEEQCRELVRSAGALLHGYDLPATVPTTWRHSNVNVHIKGRAGAGFVWSYLATHSKDVRVFRGPPETCPHHPWDAMILRDCTPCTDNLYDHFIGSRRWDILLMKMCEDHDFPWLVTRMRDVGSADDDIGERGYGFYGCSCHHH